MQPAWRDDIGLTNKTGGSPEITLSAFTVMHRKNADDAGSYERVMLTGTLDVIDEVNEQVFQDENKASEDQVCLGHVVLWSGALPDATWAAFACAVLCFVHRQSCCVHRQSEHVHAFVPDGPHACF